MKKITRTSEEYRKCKEKELEDRKCPECDKKGTATVYNIFETVYSCECGCEWYVVDEKSFKRVESYLKVEPLKKGETIFEKIRKKFRI